ncbi:MAG TPA: PD-(D/E)XK nuclease family protein [Bacteroidota bacterium]|nr:PD-(D/E)XK nuclease family protein [Bacteroidota bacterium]
MPVILHHGPPAQLLPFHERVRRSRMDGCLVVVPTRRRVRHLSREIMRLSPGAVAPALPLHTMESLCRALYGALPGARPLAAGPVRTLIFHRAIAAVAGSLSYFSAPGGEARLPRGTFDRLTETITRLKESGIYHQTLADELAISPGAEQPRLRDVASVYGAYEQELLALGAEDSEGVYRALAPGASQAEFTGAFRKLFPGVETLSLAGFDEFSVPEIRVLRRICDVPDLTVTLMFDYAPGNPALFGHLEENYRLLMELGFRESHGEKEAAAAAFFFGCGARPPAARKASEHIARTLFAGHRRSPRGDLRSVATVMAARSRVHEVECICKLIRRLVAENPGRDLSAICVALRTPGKYTDIMREMFAEYEIPVNITDRFELARSPLTVSILGFLRIPLLGFRREDVLRAAASPYVALPVPGSPFDGGNLSSVARRVRATAGLEGWRRRIDRAVDETNRRLAGATDEAERRRVQVELDGFRKAAVDIDALGALLAPFGRQLTAEEFAAEVLALLSKLSVISRLIDPALRGDPFLAEKDIRALNAFTETLHAVAATARMQDGPGTPRPLRVHYDRLKTALGQERYNVREQFGRGVLVTSIEETRELPVEVMIVGGLVDGEFPTVYQSEIFLSARRRREREQRHTWENRYLFYQAVTNWTEHLYLTYPLREGENELVRSSFIDAFLASCDVTLWEDPGEIPFASDIASRGEYLRHLSALGGQAPAMPAGMEEAWGRIRASRDVELRRTDVGGAGAFGGEISGAISPGGRDHLEKYRERVFSVSQLETYALCPFRFFARSVLRLTEREEFEEGITPLEKGALLHSALFQFYTARRARGAPPLRGASADVFEEAAAELAAIASAILEPLDLPDAFWELDKELVLGRNGKGDGLLRRFLECERSREDSMEPAYFEVSFGGTPGERGRSDGLLSGGEPVELGKARLRGKIDRVEKGEGCFTVVDYKTGRDLPTVSDIRRGLSLQLPVYLLAAGELLEGAGDRNLAPAGGLYYRLRDPVELKPALVAEEFRGRAFSPTSQTKQKVAGAEEVREVIRETARVAGGILDGIAGGHFPLTSPELVQKLCGHCGYRTSCRIQSLKHVTSASAEDQ